MHGCYNRPPYDSEVVVREESPLHALARRLLPGSAPYHTVRWLASIAPPRVAYPNRMEPECQYTHTELGQADKNCIRCVHRKGSQ